MLYSFYVLSGGKALRQRCLAKAAIYFLCYMLKISIIMQDNVKFLEHYSTQHCMNELVGSLINCSLHLKSVLIMQAKFHCTTVTSTIMFSRNLRKTQTLFISPTHRPLGTCFNTFSIIGGCMY